MAQRKSKNRPSGKRKARPHRRQTKSAGPVQAPSPAEPGLIAGSLYEFAKRINQGSLKYEDISPPDFGGEHMISLVVEALLEGDETKALDNLAWILENYPLKLWHPVVEQQFQHMFYLLYWHGPQDFYDRVNDALRRLIEAWAKGMTLGCEVSITKPKGRAGQTPWLFPHLEEKEGYFESNRAFFERNRAHSLRDAYDDLMNHLEKAVRWKAVRYEYREYIQDGQDPKPLVQEVAAEIGHAFECFLKKWDQRDGQPLPEQTLCEIVRKALQVRRGGNPRHKIACGLLGTLLGRFPNLIESTLKTLRKHGIRGRSRPSRSQSAKRKLL